MFFTDDESYIDYSRIVEKAMRNIVKLALEEIKENKDSKRYCFMFEVNTRYKGVKLPKKVLSKYKETIILVIQYQFSNLNIFDDYFSVNLSFDGVFSKVVIPFDSILSFSDKENEFGMKFDDDFSMGGDGLLIEHGPYEDFIDETSSESPDVFSDNLVNFNDLKVKK